MTQVSLRYFRLETIGVGGMGSVVRAYDARLQREVALKELRRRSPAEEGARLVREARAMAKLSHPNVVSVFDVDTTPERVTISMEYVPGVTLRRWLEAEPRDVANILAVFEQAGRGLAAAHAAGIVHHDFKPDNVLAVPDDSAPGGARIKVTDFGIARLIGAPDSFLSEPEQAQDRGTWDEWTTSVTKEGQVAGTPRYMAPEQHGGAQTGPATDQYAFAVALWEALTRQPPFRGVTVHELVQAKVDGPPSWPGIEAVPVQVRRALRRALAPQPSDRFSSIEELLTALRRSSTAMRAGSLAGAAAFVFIAAALAWPALRDDKCSGGPARIARAWAQSDRAQLDNAFSELDAAHASQTATRVEAGLDRYTRRWATAHTDACAATTIRGELPAAVMDRRMACLRRGELEVGALVDVMTGGDAVALRNAPSAVAGLPPPERCLEIDEVDERFAAAGPTEAAALARLEQSVARGRALFASGQFEQVLEITTGRMSELVGLPPAAVVFDVMIMHSEALERLGRYPQAERMARRVFELGLVEGSVAGAARAATNLVSLLGSRLGRFAEAHAMGRLALALAPDRWFLATALTRVGELHMLQADYDQARRMLGEALALREQIDGPDHDRLVTPLMMLASIDRREARYVDARRRLERAIAIDEATAGDAHPDLIILLSNYGNVLASQGKVDGAVAAYERSLRIHEGNFGPEHPGLGLPLHNLANVRLLQERPAEAEELLRRALENTVLAFGPDHPEVAMTLASLADACLPQQKLPEAERLQRRSIEILEEQFGSTHPEVMMTRASLAKTLGYQGKMEEAEALLRRELVKLDATMGRLHPQVATIRAGLGDLLARAGRFDDAQKEYRVAARSRNTEAGAAVPQLHFAVRKLVWIMRQQGRATEARQEFGDLEPLPP